MAEKFRTPEEWSYQWGITVVDPDGWRIDGKSWDEPISKDEWLWRYSASTVDNSEYRPRL